MSAACCSAASPPPQQSRDSCQRAQAQPAFRAAWEGCIARSGGGCRDPSLQVERFPWVAQRQNVTAAAQARVLSPRFVLAQLLLEPRLLPCPFEYLVAGFAGQLQRRTAKADQLAANSAQACARSAAWFSSPSGSTRPTMATEATNL